MNNNEPVDPFDISSLVQEDQRKAEFEMWYASFNSRMEEIRCEYFPELRFLNDSNSELYICAIQAQLDDVLAEQGLDLDAESYGNAFNDFVSDKLRQQEEFRHFSVTVCTFAFIVDRAVDQSIDGRNMRKKSAMMTFVQQVKSGELSDHLPYIDIADKMIPGESLNLDETSEEYKEYQELWLQKTIDQLDSEMNDQIILSRFDEFREWLSDLLSVGDFTHSSLVPLSLMFVNTRFLLELAKKGNTYSAQQGNILESIRIELEAQGYNTGFAEAIFTKMVELYKIDISDE